MLWVAVFEHPPGRGGRTESYLIGDWPDILSNLAWGARKLGRLSDIIPAWEGCPTSHDYVLVWSFSLQSRAAQAMAAREQLRQLLPKGLRPLVSRARTFNRLGKRVLLGEGEVATQSKCDLFLERRLSSQERSELSWFIELADFWNAATGRVAAARVEDLFKRPRQLPLSWEDQVADARGIRKDDQTGGK